MLGKGKKIVSQAYKEKLLAEIAYYEKRIDDALHKRSQTVFENESSDEDNTNPYKLNIRQSGLELRQQEASLSDRASMTLELALLTIMQSEVNVMVTPPEVRKPVTEEGTWLEVAAECKVDLVSFTITFHAHKPHQRFAPIRYRNLSVNLVKEAHAKELAQSVLSKLNKPHLALQVIQSYATAFRSRRATLLQLAETYADMLKMEARAGGGFRVQFLNMLQVDWTLENLWSPVAPFCHRMRFELEYMQEEYIHGISKLYRLFKDPTLGTAERTRVFTRIFDTCQRARGSGSATHSHSDSESSRHRHERRTTIDQEPDVPNVEHSPQRPRSRDYKAQNRRTTMDPPKTIPKKAKKANKKSRDKYYVDNRNGGRRSVGYEGNGDKVERDKVRESRRANDIDDVNNAAEKTNSKDGNVRESGSKDIQDSSNAIKKSTGKENKSAKKRSDDNTYNAMNDVENRKGTKRRTEDESTNTANKKAKRSKTKDADGNRKGVKRGIESDASNNAKKSKTDQGHADSKSNPGLKGGKNSIEDGETETVVLKEARRKVSDKVASKNVKEIDIASSVTGESDAINKGKDDRASKKVSHKTKKTKNKKVNKENENSYDKNTEESNTYSKKMTENAAKVNENDVVNSKKTKDINVNAKNDAEIIPTTKTVATKTTDAKKDKGKRVKSKHGTKKDKNTKSDPPKDENAAIGVPVAKDKASEDLGASGASSDHQSTKTDAVTVEIGKTVDPNEAVTKAKSSKRKSKNKHGKVSKKLTKSASKGVNVVEKTSKTSEVQEKGKDDVPKDGATKYTNAPNQKEVVKQVDNKEDINEATRNHNKEANVKETINKEDVVSKQVPNKNASKEVNVVEKTSETSEVQEKGKDDMPKDGTQKVTNEATKNHHKETNVKETNNKGDVVSKQLTKNASKEVNVDGKVSKTSEVKEKGKDDMPKDATAQYTNASKPKEVKQVDNKKVTNKATKHHNKGVNVKDSGKFHDKVKGISKATSNDKNKETTQSLPEKNNVLNPKSDGQISGHYNKISTEKTSIDKVTDKNNEVVKKQHNPPYSKFSNRHNYKEIKKSTHSHHILKEKSSRNEQNSHKIVDKNATYTKEFTFKVPHKPDQLKTKIPMMNKTTLGGKVLPNVGRISRRSIEKTKIPQKSLPVFKKPKHTSRHSPKKSSTFKPSSHGFSNKQQS